MSDRDIIIAVEVVRVLLDAAFTYAEINKLPRADVDRVFLESYARIDGLDPANLPKVE